ncbi:preprotein translocase subunit SecG [Helicobacter sp. MIT 00-7814]|uniref:preprotein translocase subunit SecG n=1 Tax=unclassified Helicobacter TaxID=2593540 RepID=UPI000E1F221E|nr:MULTISPECIES: preprotein translocase subunit SecG [unclassified Helicobacter]RDU54587.1 preprotein translocase subunit SecG [Helicobacter sp. MIT 00-7814]RDU54646.1 preprotein translocase subunit SecG [Helicobacter sp. MIT 99-10781]
MAFILLIVQIVLVFLITIVVLLQKSSSLGLGAYSGSNESMFGAKGPAGFLAKATMFLGLLFLANTIALGYLYNKQTSLTDSLQNGAQNGLQNSLQVAPAENPFAMPDSPLAPAQDTSTNVPAQNAPANEPANDASNSASTPAQAQ